MDVRLHPLEYTRRNLPPVCAVTGERAGGYVQTGARKTPSAAYLLLLFLGPLGWLILLAVLINSDATFVNVPVSQQVYDDIQERRHRTRWVAGALAAATVAFAFLAQGALFPTAWVVFAPAIALAVWVVSVPRRRIRITIDGVGLVTIHRIHPNFAAAVAAWRDAAPAEIG